jgi:hypothetical protein
VTAAQLLIDGGETAHPPFRGRRRPLNKTHERIMRVIRRDGVIRSVEAGLIVHQERGTCAFGTHPNQWPMQGMACCPYASSDGRAMMVRLMDRGLVIRGPQQGTWIENPSRREGANQ